MVASVESDPAFPLPLLARYFSCAPSCAPPPHFIQQKALVTALPCHFHSERRIPNSHTIPVPVEHPAETGAKKVISRR